MKKVLVLSLACLAGVVLTVKGEGFRIAEKGVAKAEIVLGERASWAAKWGAVELRHFLKATTGGDFQIVTEQQRHPTLKPIFVGASEGTARMGGGGREVEGPAARDSDHEGCNRLGGH